MPNNRLSLSSLLKAGGAGVLTAILANVITRLLLGALILLPVNFQPFGYGPIIAFTTVFTLIGVGVLILVNRMFQHPIKVYNRVSVAAFFVSLLPNLAGAVNPEAMPMGGSGENYLTLILFHVVAAVAYLTTVNLMARKT